LEFRAWNLLAILSQLVPLLVRDSIHGKKEAAHWRRLYFRIVSSFGYPSIIYGPTTPE
jgi:hypothetical protein